MTKKVKKERDHKERTSLDTSLHAVEDGEDPSRLFSVIN